LVWLKKRVKNTGILMAVYQYSVFAISIHSILLTPGLSNKLPDRCFQQNGVLVVQSSEQVPSTFEMVGLIITMD
jgi:hypothetical protein